MVRKILLKDCWACTNQDVNYNGSFKDIISYAHLMNEMIKLCGT